jgi:Leucine-rich repeat (LRR) protein
LNGRDPASVYTLDLSNCDLSTANFTAFARLRKLNLSGNKFNVKQLEQAGLVDLVHLSELQLHNNAITSSDEFGDFLGRCRGIRYLGCQSNPITKDGTYPERLRLLAAITIIGEPRLPLRELDGKVLQLFHLIYVFMHSCSTH